MPPMTVAEAIAELKTTLADSGIAEPRREAGLLVQHVLNCDRAALITRSNKELTDEQLVGIREAGLRRSRGEPFQYIRGLQEFYGLDFEVAAGVLIPRPESEILVERALELIKDEAEGVICDVGTGTGCIIISLLVNRPDLSGVALEISDGAKAIARRNAEKHGVTDRLDIRRSDLFSAAASGEQFSMIVSNPPYVTESAFPSLQREVRDYEPVIALTSGADGLNVIRRLLTDSPAHLMPGGFMLFEIGYDQEESTRALIDPEQWELVEYLKDLQGISRIVVLKRSNS